MTETWTEVLATAAAHIIPLAAMLLVQLRHERKCLQAARTRARR